MISVNKNKLDRFYIIYYKIHQIYIKLFLLSHIDYIKAWKFRNKNDLKLNIGCGNVKFAKWINIDIEPSADITIDVTKGLPFKDNSSSFIFNEHFIEHITYENSEKILKEFYRILKNGGVVRIATPDLDYVVNKYLNDWKNQEWLSWQEYSYIKTKGRMINVSFREWGHKYLYNEEDLTILLKTVGFRHISRCEFKKSNYPELNDLETRKDSKLILEAIK